MGPELHAAFPQPPATATGSTEHVPHEHAQGSGGAVEFGCGTRPADGLRQAWIEDRHWMAETGQVPGGAKAKGTGTDNGDWAAQLKASAGITSE